MPEQSRCRWDGTEAQPNVFVLAGFRNRYESRPKAVGQGEAQDRGGIAR